MKLFYRAKLEMAALFENVIKYKVTSAEPTSGGSIEPKLTATRSLQIHFFTYLLKEDPQEWPWKTAVIETCPVDQFLKEEAYTCTIYWMTFYTATNPKALKPIRTGASEQPLFVCNMQTKETLTSASGHCTSTQFDVNRTVYPCLLLSNIRPVFSVVEDVSSI